MTVLRVLQQQTPLREQMRCKKTHYKETMHQLRNQVPKNWTSQLIKKLLAMQAVLLKSLKKNQVREEKRNMLGKKVNHDNQENQSKKERKQNLRTITKQRQNLGVPKKKFRK